VTHDLSLAARANRTITMEDGRIVADQTITPDVAVAAAVVRAGGVELAG
jgi:ABC-type lipoprotein export system ATPase subunit